MLISTEKTGHDHREHWELRTPRGWKCARPNTSLSVYPEARQLYPEICEPVLEYCDVLACVRPVSDKRIVAQLFCVHLAAGPRDSS